LAAVSLEPDQNIKQEYSVALLLEYYGQRLELQSRLVELYHERRGEMAGRIKARMCFASLMCALVLLLASCDFRLMSQREVEEYLEKRYGQEFTVLSSESVTEDYYDNDVWKVRVYTVSPRDDLETHFFVFNTVEGENFGVPGFVNRLSDTYSLDIFGGAFEMRAVDTDVEYSFNYFYPVKSSSVYYSDLYVNIEPVSSENLETVCTVLSQAYAGTFEKIKDIPYGVTVLLTYREPAWPENQSCLIKIDSLYLGRFDTNTETIEKYILDEVSKYQERLASLVQPQFPTNCDAHLTGMNFQTRSSTTANFLQA